MNEGRFDELVSIGVVAMTPVEVRVKDGNV
jgi:hypothetical protein